ncbi:N-acylneuraminate cytidylyltransferase [Paramagnetospirillum caucaseum]|uniref:N-acylneuraminate cytidylyltransferase n=1 Tax=Paramagnetospirillum caucaseum TaxID=1244869 RepID=M2ZPU6_9PROT|nr:N-acylneuraminate cytidylyltransferase [Paramagnetospirillum caucaseum]EME69327.1 N-acylneuraminate cytidylyltransferase [Paramagnetospirillum caucaseum]
MTRHIAVIPARAGSVGLPGKNRMFFDATANFIDAEGWFGRTIVSTDDPVVADKARGRGYEVRNRPATLAGPAVSIKSMFEDLIPAMAVEPDDVLWLFYLPVLYKNAEDFATARAVAETPGTRSVMSFIPAKTHPYSCWQWDGGTLTQYIENDLFRRQDMPPAWMTYHYTCCFRAGILDQLNSELVGSATMPVFLSEATARNLIEVDTPEDLERWQRFQAEKNR